MNALCERSISMEISLLEKSSHFNVGVKTKPMMDANYNFDDITKRESNALSTFDFGINRPHYPENVTVTSGFLAYPKDDRSNNDWAGENVKCKQETDPLGCMSGTQATENSNYDSENDDLNKPYQYAYDPISNIYANNKNSAIPTMRHDSSTSSTLPKHNSVGGHQHPLGPYQISSSKNQLPSWYDPPSYSQLQYPQYPYRQGNYVGSDTASVENNMRNMIHLSSRYLLLVLMHKF